MARRSRQTLAPVISPAILKKINASFDFGLVPTEEPDELSRPALKRRRLVVDDEEEEILFEPVEPLQDQIMAEVVSELDVEDGGGFMLEEGGFLPEGGGFLPDSEFTGGGFMPDEPTEGTGFVAEEEILPTPIKNRKLVPPANPFALLPLLEVPLALQRLGIPRASQISLMAMFGDATEKNEDEEDCISRTQFIQGCSVFVKEDDDSEEEMDELENGNGSGAEYREEEVQSSSRRSSRVTRLNPRAAGVPSEADESRNGSEMNEGENSVVDSDSEEVSEMEEDDLEILNSSAKGKGKKSSPTVKKTRGKKKDRNRILSRAEENDAKDTFDLFFSEDSAQMFQESKDRIIGMEEMRYVSKLLGQKLNDEDLFEMLEYAARDEGLVDITAFPKTLAEAV